MVAMPKTIPDFIDDMKAAAAEHERKGAEHAAEALRLRTLIAAASGTTAEASPPAPAQLQAPLVAPNAAEVAVALLRLLGIQPAAPPFTFPSWAPCPFPGVPLPPVGVPFYPGDVVQPGITGPFLPAFVGDTICGSGFLDAQTLASWNGTVGVVDLMPGCSGTFLLGTGAAPTTNSSN